MTQLQEANLKALSELIEVIDRKYSTFLQNLPSNNAPKAGLENLINENKDTIGHDLSKFQTVEADNLETQLAPIIDDYSSLVQYMETMSSWITEIQNQLGGEDQNIFNIDLPAFISEEVEGEKSAKIGDFTAIVNLKGTVIGYFDEKFLSYLYGEAEVKLTTVDAEAQVFYCELSEPSENSVLKYSNYLKSNAEKITSLDEIDELFNKAENLKKFFENNPEAYDKAPKQFQEIHKYITEKYILLTAEKNSQITPLSDSDIDKLNDPDDEKAAMKSGELPTYGLKCRFQNQEYIVATFNVQQVTSEPTGQVLSTYIYEFPELTTNQSKVLTLLTKKLIEINFEIPGVGILEPIENSNIFLVTSSKLKGIPNLIQKTKQEIAFFYQIKSQ